MTTFNEWKLTKEKENKVLDVIHKKGKKLGGGFRLEIDGSLWHNENYLFEPHNESETALARYLPNLNAVLTKKYRNKGGMLIGENGIILATRAYDEDSPFNSLWLNPLLRTRNIFNVNFADANRALNMVLVRKVQNDEYKWAVLFPRDFITSTIDHDAGLIIANVSVGELPVYINFSFKKMKFVKLKRFLAKNAAGSTISFNAIDAEHARETAGLKRLDVATVREDT